MLKLEFYSKGDCVVMEGGWDTEMYFVTGEGGRGVVSVCGLECVVCELWDSCSWRAE